MLNIFSISNQSNQIALILFKTNGWIQMKKQK